jgi:hypothetical protein
MGVKCGQQNQGEHHGFESRNSRRCRRTCVVCICAQCIGCGAQIALQIARHGRLPGWRVRRTKPGSDLQRSTEYRRRQLQVDENAQGLEIHIEEDLQLAPRVCPREPIGRPRSAIIGTARMPPCPHCTGLKFDLRLQRLELALAQIEPPNLTTAAAKFASIADAEESWRRRAAPGPRDRVSVEINPLREGDEKSAQLTRVVLTETPAWSWGRRTRTSTSSVRSEFGHPRLKGEGKGLRLRCRRHSGVGRPSALTQGAGPTPAPHPAAK